MVPSSIIQWIKKKIIPKATEKKNTFENGKRRKCRFMAQQPTISRSPLRSFFFSPPSLVQMIGKEIWLTSPASQCEDMIKYEDMTKHHLLLNTFIFFFRHSFENVICVHINDRRVVWYVWTGALPLSPERSAALRGSQPSQWAKAPTFAERVNGHVSPRIQIETFICNSPGYFSFSF